jgi:hypothetical protein
VINPIAKFRRLKLANNRAAGNHEKSSAVVPFASRVLPCAWPEGQNGSGGGTPGGTLHGSAAKRQCDQD